MSEHIVPKSTYYAIFLALMVGTAATVGAAFVDLGSLNTVVALAIAITKAALVVLFFMHVKYSPKLTWLVVIGSIFWLLLLLGVTLGDYMTRSWGTYG
ncbi:MAG: cytochrome C oxidase subunit IV family protein [Vicinamibacterales bacterium]